MTAVHDIDLADFGAAVAKGPVTSEWLTISQDLIDSFATLTGDRQWIHVDRDRCEIESPFDEPIAHGCLVLALVPRLFASAIRVTGSRVHINMGYRYVRFITPVRTEDKIRARITPKEIKLLRGDPEVVWGIYIDASRNRLPAAALDWIVRYPKSAPPAANADH